MNNYNQDRPPPLLSPDENMPFAQALFESKFALELLLVEKTDLFYDETLEAPRGWLNKMACLNVKKGPHVDAVRAQEIADDTAYRYSMPKIVVAMLLPVATPFGGLHGFYLPSKNTIFMYTHTMRVLLHELAHAITAHRHNTLGHGPLHLQTWSDLEFHYQLFPEEFPHLPRELPHARNHTL
jgi:hypothetical protein